MKNKSARCQGKVKKEEKDQWQDLKDKNQTNQSIPVRFQNGLQKSSQQSSRGLASSSSLTSAGKPDTGQTIAAPETRRCEEPLVGAGGQTPGMLSTGAGIQTPVLSQSKHQTRSRNGYSTYFCYLGLFFLVLFSTIATFQWLPLCSGTGFLTESIKKTSIPFLLPFCLSVASPVDNQSTPFHANHEPNKQKVKSKP